MKAYDQKIKETCDEIDEAIAKGTYGGLEREARERNEAARRIGQTPEGNENPPETEKTEFRAPTEEDLKRFTAAAVAAFPQYAEIKIGLAGFELTIAILTALPGFVVEHLPWNPATAGI